LREKDIQKKICDKAYVIDESKGTQQSEDSEDEDYELSNLGVLKMMKISMTFDDSDYNSSSDEEESRLLSPVLDDTNIFLSEVIDSLARGYQEKSNPDFLILEINSSRYAYNMSLKEVNYNVVKAIFNLNAIKEAETTNILLVIKQVFECLGPVVSNYIKTSESMIDALKALEECFNEQISLKSKAAAIIHYLYDKEYLTEKAILMWHDEINEDDFDWLRDSLKKLIEWLNQSSEEESSEDDDD